MRPVTLLGERRSYQIERQETHGARRRERRRMQGNRATNKQPREKPPACHAARPPCCLRDGLPPMTPRDPASRLTMGGVAWQVDCLPLLQNKKTPAATGIYTVYIYCMKLL